MNKAEREAEDARQQAEKDEPIIVTKGQLRALLDVATGSMDFGSGFLCEDEVNVLRDVAQLLGIDPMVVTPSNLTCQFKGTHQWSKEPWGALGGKKGTWHCVLCRHTSTERPEGAGTSSHPK